MDPPSSLLAALLVLVPAAALPGVLLCHRAALILRPRPHRCNAGSIERESSGAEESSAQVMTMASLGVHNDVLGESPRKRSRGKSG